MACILGGGVYEVCYTDALYVCNRHGICSTGLQRRGVCGLQKRALCVTATECVGLPKKDLRATVTKVLVTKTGCVHVPVYHRNRVCGIQKRNMWVLQKEAVGLKKRNVGFVCHQNEISGSQKWEVYETCIFFQHENGIFLRSLPKQGR